MILVRKVEEKQNNVKDIAKNIQLEEECVKTLEKELASLKEIHSKEGNSPATNPELDRLEEELKKLEAEDMIKKLIIQLNLASFNPTYIFNTY